MEDFRGSGGDGAAGGLLRVADHDVERAVHLSSRDRMSIETIGANEFPTKVRRQRTNSRDVKPCGDHGHLHLCTAHV